MSQERMPESGSQKSQEEKNVDINDVGVFTTNRPTTAKEVIEEMKKHGMRPMSIEDLNSVMNPKEDTIDLKEGEDYTVEDDNSKKLKELNE